MYMEISVLGPLRVVFSGEDVTPTGSRQRRLLAALADAGPDGASADRIAEVVWDDHDRPSDVASHVRTAVNRLRRQLGSAPGEHGPVVTRPGGYALADDAVEVDLWQFERRIVDASDELDPVRRSVALSEALDLWRGQIFDELSGLPQLLPSIARLEELRLGAEEDLVEGWLEQGRPDHTLARVLSLVDEHPYRERLRRSQVLALYRLGRQTDALRVVRAHRARMNEDLGLGPSPQVDELEQLVLQHDSTLGGPGLASRSLRGYRLSEVLGIGEASAVYRALQPTLDRPVAIKVVRTRALNDPSDIRRFEREATLVARLEHPFVVPLYDYWREPGRVCLVSRLLPRSLAAAIEQDGPWAPARVRVLVSQIGGALLAAHSAGIVHRDVKAANILLDDEGRALLADFGVGAATDRRASDDARQEIGPAPTPRDVQRDVAGLATVAVQALTGSLVPIVDITSSLERTDLPADAVEALAIAAEMSPTAPEIGLSELVMRVCTEESAMVATTESGHTSDAVSNVANPYRGLEPFEAADERFFAGRSGIVAEMAARWSAGERLLVVTGASGVGKSSIVRAGFLPALDRGDIDGSDRWFVANMAPGSDPVRALADSLAAVATQEHGDLHQALRRGDRPVASAIRAAFGADDVRLVVFIDQLEELFSAATADVAERFLDLLGGALADDQSNLRVVATLRADYFGHPLECAAFAPLYRASVVATPPLAAAELEAAITGPAAAVGVTCEPALVATLVGEVSQNPMALPLLQLTLTELFVSRTGNEMTLAHYHELGGLAGSLARRGESLVGSLGDDEVATVRDLFGQLTDVDGERGPVRRRTSLARLLEMGIPFEVVDRVVESRLVALDRDPHSRAPIATVTHEAVLTGWPRLAAWLEADRELLRQRAVLMQTAAAWERDGRDVSGLLRGRRLDAAEDVGSALPLGALEREFLDASAQVRAEEDRRERARLRRLRGVAALAVTVALIAVTAGGVALRLRSEARVQSARAEDATARAEASRDEALARAEDARTAALARSAQALANTQPVLARQLAVEALDRSNEPSTRQALASVLSAAPHFAERVAQFGGGTMCAAMSSGGTSQGTVLGVTEGSDGTIRATIIELASGRTTAQLVVPPTLNTRCPQPNASGSSAWAATDAGSLVVTGDGTVSTDMRPERSAWTNDQEAIVGVIAGDVGVAARLRVLDARDLDQLVDLEVALDGTDNRVGDVRATAPDGIAVVADGAFRVALVDLATGSQQFLPATASPDPDIAIRLDVSDDGTVVAATGLRSLLVWQVAADDVAPARLIALTGSPIDLGGTTGSPVRPRLSPSGARVAVITSAGIETFDISSGAPIVPAIEVAVSAGALRFLAEDRLAVLTAAGEVLHFDLEPARGLATTVVANAPGGIVSRDGASLTGVENGRNVSVSLPEGRRSDHGPAGEVTVAEAGNGVRVHYHPQSTEIARFEEGVETHRRSLSHLVEPGNFLGQTPRVAHDRIMLMLRGRSNFDNPTGQVIVLDADTLQVVSAPSVPDVRRAELLSADEFVHGNFTGGVAVRSLDGDVVDELPAFSSSIQSFAGTAVGELLLGLDDGTTLVWSRARGEIVRELVGPPETVISVRESADGTIVAQHLSGRIVVWWPESDVLGAQVLGPVGYTGIITVVDDRVLVAAVGDVLEISLDVEVWRQRACSTAGPQTDPVRWRAAVGIEPPERGVCVRADR
jgi:DNA-binding SARP family transcriptional activator